MPSSSAAGLPGWLPPRELIEAGTHVILLDQEPEQSLGGQAFWSFGGLFLVDSPEQRRMRIRDSPRAGAAGLAGLGRLRPRGGPLAAQVGRGLRRLRRRREARLAARPGHALVSRRRLGRARRLHGHRARQLGAALPCHLGHRPRRRRALRRSACARARSEGLVSLRFRHRVNGLTTTAGVVDGVRGDILEPSSGRTRRAELARRRRRFRAARRRP